MIHQAGIMDRTEKGVLYNDLTMMKYIGLTNVRELLKKDVEDLEKSDQWKVFLKVRHEPENRHVIEKIKEKNEDIKAIDDELLKVEDDVLFMREMAEIIYAGCEKMDVEDAERAREEAKIAKKKEERAQEELRKVKEELRKVKEEARKVKEEAQEEVRKIREQANFLI